MDPILTTLLDLDAQLGGKAGLCIGGGLGLYLKQQHLRGLPEVRTMFPFDALPAARTTEDIDLFLRAEVVADPQRMRQLRGAVDALGCVPIQGAEYMQFVRQTPGGKVKIDLLAGPPGEFADRIKRGDKRRMQPMGPSVGLHAHAVDEALAVEVDALTLPIAGRLSSGIPHTTNILIPQTFSYLLMKLTSFRDRCQDPRDDYGRRHALDAYRLIGLLTRKEDERVGKLSAQHREAAAVVAVRCIVHELFGDPDALGLLRVREHPLYVTALRLDEFRRELQRIFPAV